MLRFVEIAIGSKRSHQSANAPVSPSEELMELLSSRFNFELRPLGAVSGLPLALIDAEVGVNQAWNRVQTDRYHESSRRCFLKCVLSTEYCV